MGEAWERTSWPNEVLTKHRDQIAERSRRIGRRQGLPEADLDDFVGDVMVRLMDDDGAILRAFRGRSRLMTYLTTVIRHFAQDERNRRWGKWHASAEAIRMGVPGQILERLLRREGLALRQAERILRARFPELSAADVEAMAARLPVRQRLRSVGDSPLDELPAPDRSDEGDERAERDARKAEVLRQLHGGLASLDPDARQCVERRFRDGWPAERVADTLGLTTTEVYRHIDRAKKRLRVFLESHGVDARIAMLDIGWDLVDRDSL